MSFTFHSPVMKTSHILACIFIHIFIIKKWCQENTRGCFPENLNWTHLLIYPLNPVAVLKPVVFICLDIHCSWTSLIRVIKWDTMTSVHLHDLGQLPLDVFFSCMLFFCFVIVLSFLCIFGMVVVVVVDTKLPHVIEYLLSLSTKWQYICDFTVCPIHKISPWFLFSNLVSNCNVCAYLSNHINVAQGNNISWFGRSWQW